MAFLMKDERSNSKFRHFLLSEATMRHSNDIQIDFPQDTDSNHHLPDMVS